MPSPSRTDGPADVPLAPLDVDSCVAAVLDEPGAGVAVGTFGAIAEFVRPLDAGGSVRHSTGAAGPGQPGQLGYPGQPGQHSAITDGGAVRVDTVAGLVPRAWRRPTGSGDSWSHAVALCLPADRAAGPGRDRVTELGPDIDALLPGGRDEVLVDLGLGVGHLEACVRTADPQLLELLRRAEGHPLDADLSAALVAAGPARVFRTVAARIEVTTPIPPPTGTSPAGPHTHLLPALLAHRRAHAATDPIPDGHVPVVTLFPAHPQRDALGRVHDTFDEAADAAFDRVLAAFGEPDEVATARHVRDALAAGALPPEAQALSSGSSRASRRGWEVELRRAHARGETTDAWTAWRAASWRLPTDGSDGSGGSDEADLPFHESH